MAAVALERAVFAIEFTAIDFVRIISAIVIMIASPLSRDALSVGTLKFGFGTLSVQSLAQVLGLVRVVAAIVFEIAKPPLRYTPVVLAVEVGRRMAFRTVVRQFVRTVTTIVFAVAEQPFRYAPVVCPAGTPLPAGRAIALSAHKCGFVRIVATIVIEIANP